MTLVDPSFVSSSMQTEEWVVPTQQSKCYASKFGFKLHL